MYYCTNKTLNRTSPNAHWFNLSSLHSTTTWKMTQKKQKNKKWTSGDLIPRIQQCIISRWSWQTPGSARWEIAGMWTFDWPIDWLCHQGQVVCVCVYCKIGWLCVSSRLSGMWTLADRLVGRAYVSPRQSDIWTLADRLFDCVCHECNFVAKSTPK